MFASLFVVSYTQIKVYRLDSKTLEFTDQVLLALFVRGQFLWISANCIVRIKQAQDRVRNICIPWAPLGLNKTGQGITRNGHLFFATFQIVQILVHSHFHLISQLLALEAIEPVSKPVTQMAVELIKIISFQYSKRDECKSYIIFYVKTTTNEF